MAAIRVTTKRCTFQVLREEATLEYPRGAVVAGPQDIAQIARQLIGADISEVILAFFFDARQRVVGYAEIARGTLNAARLTPRDVLVRALSVHAGSVAICHNHPSGEVTPSRPDRLVTTALRDACSLLGIPLLDHVIVTDSAHFSFKAEEGW